MHSTLNEIAVWIRTVELPPTTDHGDMTPFYEDKTINDSTQDQEDEKPGYQQGRKINYTYPSPPSTPPPVTLLAQLFSDKNVLSLLVQNNNGLPLVVVTAQPSWPIRYPRASARPIPDWVKLG
jgi:hypothetical protein